MAFFVLVFFFLEYPCQISRFLSFVGSHILLLKTFFDGKPIKRAAQKVNFKTHEWQLSTRFSKVTRYIRRHERNGQRSWLGTKKYNATKSVLNQKQECKWALELVCSRYPPSGCSRPSCKHSLAPVGFSSHLFRPFYLPPAPTICPWVSEDGGLDSYDSFFVSFKLLQRLY